MQLVIGKTINIIEDASTVLKFQEFSFVSVKGKANDLTKCKYWNLECNKKKSIKSLIINQSI